MQNQYLENQQLEIYSSLEQPSIWKRWRQKLKSLTLLDRTALIGAIITLTYYRFAEPYSFCIIILSLLVLLPLLLIEKSSQFKGITKKIGVVIKTWHLMAVSLSLGLFFSVDSPAHAFLFVTIENAIKNTLTASGSGGNISFITTLFTLIRLGVLLAVITGVIYATNQAMQQGDLGPVIKAFCIGLILVVGIEGLSKWMLGDASGTTPGALLPSQTHAYQIEFKSQSTIG